MRFTVITITYNAEKYLAQMLKSVVRQDFSHFEHLIWDGGSSDRTLEIAHEFPHATLHKGQDEGIADAMNQAALLAKGDYLLFLHADDLLAHDRVLSKVATSFNQHPDIQWIYGRVHRIDAEGNRFSTTPYERFSRKRLTKYNFITHPAAFISRHLFERVGGFQKKWRYCMDYDFWLRVAAFSTPFALPTPLACFRQHLGSLSTRNSLEVADEAYEVRNQYITSPLNRLRSYRTWKRRRR